MLNCWSKNGVGHLQISRPDLHNAFNGELVAALVSGIQSLAEDPSVRVVVLSSEGRSFCAGADLNWMKGMVSASEEENRAGAERMAGLFRLLDSIRKPVVCRVQGAAIGGGVGLVSCADVVVASSRARFGLSEVRLGLAPAVISPFVVSKMGESQARRYFLTGERFDAGKALAMGLVHEVVEESQLDDAVDHIVGQLLKGGSEAQAACKDLSRSIRLGRPTAELDAANARLIARLRVSDEGQEGLGAFFEKRPPEWVIGEGES